METSEPDSRVDAVTIDYLLQELNSLRAGVSLLGLRQCNCCRHYYRCPDAKNLLNLGQLVCYKCLEEWWRNASPGLGIEERMNAERQILRWLVAYHDAKIIRDAKNMPDRDSIELKIVVGCVQCAGRGTDSGHSCQNCHGRGSEWVVVLKPQMR